LRVQAITGLTMEQLTELTRRVHALIGDVVRSGGRPAAVGLLHSVALVVYLLRHNVTQDVAAERFGVSQATASRRWDRLREIIAAALADVVPSATEAIGSGSCLVDGSLVPTWDWKDTQGMYSGKHEDTGFNLQVAATLGGDLAAVGATPVPGARHDAVAYHASGLADQLMGLHVIGDKGYAAHADLTPIKKPVGGELTEAQKEFNHDVNHFRAAVERAISHLKNWKILSTRYRAPLEKFAGVLSAVVALHFFKGAFE
jgi:hypothetical protein